VHTVVDVAVASGVTGVGVGAEKSRRMVVVWEDRACPACTGSQLG
jgi:hypothetical protein